MTVQPILAVIRRAESDGARRAQGVPSVYDVVWSGIAGSDRPQARCGKLLTEMTVAEVLAWQDSIDRRYQSEAAGAYQIMEDTLRGLAMMPSQRFGPEAQDMAALLLMEQIGLRDWQRGLMSDQRFGDALARVWAGLPVLSPSIVTRGGRTVTRGRSVYGGDGLNHATIRPEEVEAALEACRPAPVVSPAPLPRPEPAPWWRALIAAVAALFRRPA